jgi:hypothetical protein
VVLRLLVWWNIATEGPGIKFLHYFDFSRLRSKMYFAIRPRASFRRARRTGYVTGHAIKLFYRVQGLKVVALKCSKSVAFAACCAYWVPGHVV